MDIQWERAEMCVLRNNFYGHTWSPGLNPVHGGPTWPLSWGYLGPGSWAETQTFLGWSQHPLLEDSRSQAVVTWTWPELSLQGWSCWAFLSKQHWCPALCTGQGSSPTCGLWGLHENVVRKPKWLHTHIHVYIHTEGRKHIHTYLYLWSATC